MDDHRANGFVPVEHLLASDRLYVPNRNADVFVLKAGPKFDLLAVNSIGSELMNASLAVSDGDIFIRTDKNLWCIGSYGPSPASGSRKTR